MQHYNIDLTKISTLGDNLMMQKANSVDKVKRGQSLSSRLKPKAIRNSFGIKPMVKKTMYQKSKEKSNYEQLETNKLNSIDIQTVDLDSDKEFGSQNNSAEMCDYKEILYDKFYIQRLITQDSDNPKIDKVLEPKKESGIDTSRGILINVEE